MEKFLSPFKVGLVVILSALSFVFFFSSVKKGISDDSKSYTVYALFEDATGLTEKSRVQIAGITVGEIKKITLDTTGTKAKVEIKLRGDVPLKSDGTIAKKNSSILGDSYLEVTTGVKGIPISNGMMIDNALESASMGGMMNKFDAIASDIKDMTGELKKVMVDQNNMESIKAIIGNIETITEKIDKLMDKNNEKIDFIMDDIKTLTQTITQLTPIYTKQVEQILVNLNKTTTSLDGVVNENKDYITSILISINKMLNNTKSKMGSVQDSIDNLEQITENISSITGKINNGEGTVGALVNSDKLYNDVDDIMGSASDFVDNITSIQTIIDMTSVYFFKIDGGYHDFGVRFQPKLNKYYYVGVTGSPFDVLTSKSTTKTTQANIKSSLTEEVYEDTISFTLYMAYSLYFFTMKYGIFESSAGTGFDFNLFGNDLLLLTRINEFGKKELPNLTVSMRYYFFKQFYLNAGSFYMLDSAKRDYFFGLGATFNDKDLKSIFTVAPSVSTK